MHRNTFLESLSAFAYTSVYENSTCRWAMPGTEGYAAAAAEVAHE